VVIVTLTSRNRDENMIPKGLVKAGIPNGSAGSNGLQGPTTRTRSDSIGSTGLWNPPTERTRIPSDKCKFEWANKPTDDQRITTNDKASPTRYDPESRERSAKEAVSSGRGAVRDLPRGVVARRQE
jgi:hypothetical protein